MKLFANRQLTGDYGTVAPGEQFECADEIGHQLVSRGLAHLADPPKVLYESKPAERTAPVVTFETPAVLIESPAVSLEAPGVSARDPFRDLPMSNAKPQELAAESDRVFPESDISQP